MAALESGIDIVIPNWNGKKILAPCLDSIANQTYQQYAVTVVDNGSTDGSAALLREHYAEARLVVLPENQGFSAAVNIGITTGNAPFVFLLNNDTELDPDCLAQLMRAAALFKDDAFFSPKMLSYDERDVLDGAGDGFLRGGVGYRLGTMEKDSDAYNQSRRIFGACGGAALYRRSMLETIGLFDEDFFAYLEDVDLNLRANRAGFRCRYVPGAIVYHIGSATTGSKINALTVRLSTRNNFFVLVKNYPLIFFVRFFPVICIYQFFWLLFVIKKRQLHAYLSGILGFFRGFLVMAGKRREIPAASGISDRQFAQRICESERDVIASIMRRREAHGKGNRLLRMYLRLFLSTS